MSPMESSTGTVSLRARGETFYFAWSQMALNIPVIASKKRNALVNHQHSRSKDWTHHGLLLRLDAQREKNRECFARIRTTEGQEQAQAAQAQYWSIQGIYMVISLSYSSRRKKKFSIYKKSLVTLFTWWLLHAWRWFLSMPTSWPGV